ncbi:MAG: glycosyltransferase family 4 protein [bacterium]|nr:glycosyltransferase family 4 protein [bacterium]
MKIAVTSPPWISVPPSGYGGIERVVSNVVEGLTKKGHDVTLYATGDSKTTAKLSYLYQKALGNHLPLKLNPYHILNHLYHFYKDAHNKFDIVHDNIGEIALYFADLTKTPMVMTIHGTFNENTKDLFKDYGTMHSVKELVQKFKHYPYISISNKQRESLPELNYVATVYNSIILSEFDFNETGGEDMIWIGRMNYTKGVDLGIKAAETLKKKFIISSYIDSGDMPYYQKDIEPHLTQGFLSRTDELIDTKNKSQFLGNSKLFLFPIRWDEPFGIVMIEAMAAGTPLVAFSMGSVPEVMKDGETGFLVNPSDTDIRGNWIIKKTGIEGLCEAIDRIYSMPDNQYKQMRKACRAHVEKNFTIERMVDRYEEVYKKLI